MTPDNPRLSTLALVVALVISGCTDAPETPPPPEEHTVTALYELRQGLPFPSDIFTVEDPQSATGLMLDLGDQNTDMMDYAFDAEIIDEDELIELLNRLDGFSTLPQILFNLGGPIDESTLPDSPRAATLDDSSVMLFDLTTCERQAVRVRYETFTPQTNLTLHLLVASPDRPLRPARAHGLVVTKRVHATDGTRLGSAPDFEAVLNLAEAASDNADDLARARLQMTPLLACLSEVGLSAADGDLAVATTFTTQTATRTLLAARDFLHGVAAPPLAIDLDPNDDGSEDTCLPNDLNLIPDNVTDLSNVGLVLRGTFDAPELRGDDDDIHLDADGEVTVSQVRQIPFLLALPADESLQPYEVVILHHGYNARKEFLMYVADHLARRGIAVAAIDAVGHGELSGTGQFMNFFAPATVRGSFMQTQVNALRLVQALDSLEALDLSPGPDGDGTPDLNLDAPLGYIGESLGGIVGAAVLAVEPRLGAGVLNVTGGEMGGFLQTFLGSLFPEEDDLALLQFQGLLQAFFDSADPLIFSRHVVREPVAGAVAKQILFQPVVGDHLVSAGATEALAHGIGVPYVCPCPSEVPMSRLERSTLPEETLGLFYFEETVHGFFLAEDNNPPVTEAAREQAAIFLSTFYETGTAQIVDPF